MNIKTITKRAFQLELSEEEMGIIAGALYCSDITDIKCFVDKYNYPCKGWNFDEIGELKNKISENINLAIERR